jgi:pteridine reductase
VLVKDKVALVTGGARRLGRILVETLADAGARVVVHHHASAREAEELAARVSGVAVRADLSIPGGARRLAEAALAVGEVAVLVNSASTFERTPFLESTEEQWESAVRLGLLSPASLARALAPRMASSGGGLILSLLDNSAHVPLRERTHHGVVKAGLLALTRGLALELAPAVRVVGLLSGLVLPDGASEAEAQGLLRRIPLGRPAEPDEVARAVRFVLENDYLTGSVLALDGGLLASFAP